jgi:hypothetical protein
MPRPTLTTAQAEAVDWAIDYLADVWLDGEADERDPDGIVPRPIVLPRLQGKALDITGVHGSVLNDLRNHLREVQADAAADYGRSSVAACNAWARVCAAMTPQQVQQLEADI